MAVHQRKIDVNGGPVEIEVFAGNLQVLSYRCVLMKSDGTGQVPVMDGTTIDTLPDTKTLLDAPALLSGRFLGVDGLLSPVKAGARQNFNVNIDVRQGGVSINGTPVVIKGQLTNTIPILEHIEL